MLKDVEKTLTGALPRIHEIDPVTGEHHTSEAAPEGHDADYVHTGTLTRIIDDNDIKVQNQVYAPIDKWISEVDVSSHLSSNIRLLFTTHSIDYSREHYFSVLTWCECLNRQEHHSCIFPNKKGTFGKVQSSHSIPHVINYMCRLLVRMLWLDECWYLWQICSVFLTWVPITTFKWLKWLLMQKRCFAWCL